MTAPPDGIAPSGSPAQNLLINQRGRKMAKIISISSTENWYYVYKTPQNKPIVYPIAAWALYDDEES